MAISGGSEALGRHTWVQSQLEAFEYREKLLYLLIDLDMEVGYIPHRYLCRLMAKTKLMLTLARQPDRYMWN